MGVFVNSGIGSQIIMAPETVYGTAPPLTNAQAYEFTSEGLELKKTVIQGVGIHAGGLHRRVSRRKLTNYSVSGPITMDLPTRYLNQLLVQMFGSKGQSGATLVQDSTHGAYSAVHGPGSMKGVSMCIQKGVASIDGNAATPFTEVGMKMTDWTLNVATGALATLATTWDGRNELAGASTNGDALNASVPTLGNFVSAADNNVFHFRQATLNSGGTVSTVQLPGSSALATPPAVPATGVNVVSPYAQLTAVTISGGTITSVLVNGVQAGTGAGTYGVPAGGMISITYSAAPTWIWFPGITSVSGATPLGSVRSAQIKYGFHLDTARYFLGSAGFKGEQIENDYRDISGQFAIDFQSAETMYNAFAAETPLTLQLDFLGDPIGDGTDKSRLTLLIPKVYLEGETPKVGGPGVVTQTAPFTGLDDGVNNPIQATYWTVDAA